MKILEELWYNGLKPSEIKTDPSYSKLLDTVLENEEKLLSKLSEKEKEAFDKLADSRMELSSLSNCEIFIKGFRMGARIMLEVMEGTGGNGV